MLLLKSDFTLHRNTNGEGYNDLVEETTDTKESKEEIKKKRARPRQKRESGKKEWEDDEIFALIDAWSDME